MRHRSVAVPEEDLAGAQVLQHVADLGDHRLGRPGDDRHPLLLILVAAEDVGRFGLLLFARGQRRLGRRSPTARCSCREVLDRRQHVGTAGQTRQVLQVGPHDALIALEERIARTL